MKQPGDDDTTWHIAVTFVVVTMVVLVVVPLLVQSRVTRLRDVIEESELARTRAIQIQFNLVREMAALRDLAVSGDSAFAVRYRAARAIEDAAFRDLAVRSARLGTAVHEPVVEARMLVEQWHARFEQGTALLTFVEPGTTMPSVRERELFEQVVARTMGIDSAIVQTAVRTRTRIQAAERTGVVLTLLTGVLALLAASAVIALHARARRYAAESEVRRAEADAALEDSARATETRSRLLRGITHDVKNPLGAARGYADLLTMQIKGPLTPEQVALVDGVQRSINGALEIIADLLDVARADSGGLHVERVETDLAELARRAVEDHRPVAEAAGHAVECAASAESIIAHTDPARVRQVLDNLLSNAFKYTPAPGRIVVRATDERVTGAPRDGTWVTVSVSDTGPGIPPHMREAVFDEFTRLDEGSTLKGHGLGLAIARRIARLLGGELNIADEGPGATLVLWLPERSNP